MKALRLFLLGALLCAAIDAIAQVPRLISYQGILTDTLGNPRPDGIVSFTFRLYETPTGGTAIWTETKNLQLRRGLFFTALGDVTPFGAGVRFDRPYWLAIQPGGEPELSPRIALTSVGYSFSAIRSDTAQFALTAPQQTYVDSARIASTVPNNSVTSAKILDGTIQRVDVASTFKAPYADTADAARTSAPSGNAGGDLTGTYPNPSIATNAVTSAKILDGTIQRVDVASTFKAPAADTADYARAAALSGSAGGDLSGTYPNPTVARLQTRPVSSSAPSSGDVLKWSGSSWAPAADAVGSLTLPFSGSANAAGSAFSITNASTESNAFGVYGIISSTSPGFFSAAVRGQNNGIGGPGIGVWGSHDGFGWGVYGTSVSGFGVHGLATATSGNCYGGWFQSNSTSGIGVFAVATATSGTTYGVRGWSESTDGRGVYGNASAPSGTTYGGYFQSHSTSGTGVFGWASAFNGATSGVLGENASTSGRGVHGLATATSGNCYGVWGESRSPGGVGTVGVAAATSGNPWGVSGETRSSGSGAYGVIGSEPSGSPGHAVYANGTLAATGTKSFQIDHPLNPETHYLSHFCTEGPEPMNAYSGNVVTDANGYATITLPNYFESINRDFRYQLTVVDDADQDFFVLAKVVREIRNNQFTIRTSAPFVEVSWEVKAIRNDRYVQQYGFQAVQEKEAEIKGKYVQPELYGMSKERGIHYRPDMARLGPTPQTLPRE